jgi:CubicO group peptidase (beta-lactamase class C family)
MYRVLRQRLRLFEGRLGSGELNQGGEEMDEQGGLAAALDQLRGVNIDEAAVRAHAMRPGHLLGVSSDRGPEDVPAGDVAAPLPPLPAPPAPPLPGPPVPGPGPAPVGYSLDVDGFSLALSKALTPYVEGFSARLTQNGMPIGGTSWNWAQEPQDGGEAWTPDVRMHVASLSKIVTAAAMTRLLLAAGISPDAPMIDHLPAYWIKGPNVNLITFANLLTHTSGLAFNNTTSRTDFEFMKEQIEAGVTMADLGQFSYQNMNFGLCRILLATINGNIPVEFLTLPVLNHYPPAEVDSMWDAATIAAYASYVASEVFAPSGVTGPDFTHDPADALAYNFPATSSWNSGDLTTLAGAAGWHMSADEVLKVMATIRRGGTILSPEQAQIMLDNHFGIDYWDTTNLGTYYAKVAGLEDNVGHQEQAVAFYLPLNMELVVLVNSPFTADLPPSTFLYTFVLSAYISNIVPVAAAASPD